MDWTRTCTLGLLLVAVSALSAGCDERDARTPVPPAEAAPVAAAAPLRERVRGRWSLTPAPSAVEKMRGDLARIARGDEAKLKEMLGRFAESMATTTLEFTADTMTTRDAGVEISSDAYRITGESKDTLTLQAGDDELTLTFRADGAATTTIKDLGPVVLRRQ